MSANAERFGRIALERREELDLTQMDVWQAGGPSNTTQTKIENGQLARLTRTTARKLDKGLQWVDGSARTTWNGGDPTPLPPSPADPVTESILNDGVLDDTAKRALIKALTERRAEAERRRSESA